jgi:phosphoribosylglycinamide formyltransferase
MKAQSLISGFCSNPTTPSIPNTKKSFFHASIPPSSASFAQSRKWVSFKIQHSVPQRVCSNKQQRLKCKNGVEEVEGSENGVRRKKLAVFVSGGGSNFRSIHEASLGGSIHGDIVVLVTNKHGLFSIFTWLFLFILIVLCGLIVVSRSEFCLIMLCVVFN